LLQGLYYRKIQRDITLLLKRGAAVATVLRRHPIAEKTAERGVPSY